MREHFGEAASALHAVGDRRTSRCVHSLSGSALAQNGRYDEALTALRQAERLAATVSADDVLAIVCGNQANVAMIRHRYEQALALAERSVGAARTVSARPRPGRGAGDARPICIRLGALHARRTVLHRALDVRRDFLFHETTGAIFDSLAQIHLVRGDYDQAEESLGKAREAYGDYDEQTPRWYDWSLRLIEARLAKRRGQFTAPSSSPTTSPRTRPSRPPTSCTRSSSASKPWPAAGGCKKPSGGSTASCQGRCAHDAGRVGRVPAGTRRVARRARTRDRGLSRPGAEHERVRLARRAVRGRPQPVRAGTLAARAGARSLARRSFEAGATFEALGAARDLETCRRRRRCRHRPGTGEFIGSPADADDAIVRRLVDAAALPELLARETLSALLETVNSDTAVLFVPLPSKRSSCTAWTGCDADEAKAIARSSLHEPPPAGLLALDGLGADAEGPDASRSRMQVRPATSPDADSACSSPSRVRDSSCARRASGRCRRATRRRIPVSSRCSPASSA